MQLSAFLPSVDYLLQVGRFPFPELPNIALVMKICNLCFVKRNPDYPSEEMTCSCLSQAIFIWLGFQITSAGRQGGIC